MSQQELHPYGAAARAAWRLDPGVTYLNHGGYGATPASVLAAQEEWRARIERNPTAFLARELPAALRRAAAIVAAALGAAGDDLVFVDNATSGINAVLRAQEFAPGDEIVLTSLAYPAIRNATRFTAARAGARVVEAPLPLPIGDDDAVIAAVAAQLGPRTRLVILDHIASASAVVLPVAALVEMVHRHGARVLIDGAHAPGQVALDLPALGAEWYVGNLHKWYFAPRACGFLWAAPAVQAVLHPLSISHGLGQGFAAEFDWTGTRDFTSCLAAPAGIEFHRGMGGATLMARNEALAREAAALLARAWDTEAAAPRSMFAAMATVRLPVSGAATVERAQRVVRWLAAGHRIEAAVSADSGALWLRIAAQAYNERADYERLAAAVARAALP
ncbi:MAG TPA: aminotransferase class V-fold PLP-dependent enzyme [Stellaceae bacterium]|nr:aminotransferase class V-fold PLP-dependent enzyme [Stellaceae bacterium]